MYKGSIGAVVISRNDNYGGDLAKKFTYGLCSFIHNTDEVYYIDWNSPGISLFDEVRSAIPKTGKLHVITITPQQAVELTNNDPDVQNCVEVLARNIGIRRLSTAYTIVTNSDIMCLSRDNINDGIIGTDTFHTIARSETDFQEVLPFAPASPELFAHMERHANRFTQHQEGSPLGARDPWSLITCPGDFQMAHSDLWRVIRGFDEDLLYRGYTDSNVQRKATYYGFNQALVRSIKAYHFRHYPQTGTSGGNTPRWNDPDIALFNYTGTKNTETWGFSDIQFDEEII